MKRHADTPFLGIEHDCYYETDPRVNKELASSLKDKNVVVAGAGRGVGRACAEFFTHASAKTISLMALEADEVVETARLCKEINPNIVTKTAGFDVTDYEKVKEFIDEVERDFGGVDVLLMNAGRPPQWLTTAESDPKIWWDTVAVSLQGAFNFSRYVLPIMQRQKGGAIIFTSSSGAHNNVRMGSYVVGKLGMVRLSEMIHMENYKDYNIRSFSFAPGAVKTRFFQDFDDAVKGVKTKNSYVVDGVENEQKSAQIAVDAFKNVTWDTPEMSAGLVTALASGKYDFLSGRYVDATVNLKDYVADRDKIKTHDLHRVRLHVDEGWMVPQSDF